MKEKYDNSKDKSKLDNIEDDLKVIVEVAQDNIGNIRV